MVDVGATMHGAKTPRRGATLERAATPMLAEVRPADDMALADYEALCRDGIHGPAQHPLWLRSWIMAAGADAIIATIHRGGRPAISLALEVAARGPFRVARFVSGRHANGNFPACAEEAAAPLSAEEAQALAAALRDARPDIDLVFLERQNPQEGGIANPLSGVGAVRSPNVSLAVDLSGGFEAVLSRANGKRKRKKHRLQVRKFEEAGGYRMIDASTPEEVDRLLDAFFAMKAGRFARKGINNVFGPAEVQTFFRMLFRDALDRKPLPFLLHGVEVAGEIQAVNGCSIGRDSVVCEFGGIREDMSNASPGFFLDFYSIEQSCRMGKALHDFSVGDEEYKRSWCDVETWQFDTLLPLTAKGRLLRLWETGRGQAVHFVKTNETLWALVKRLRAKVAGT